MSAKVAVAPGEIYNRLTIIKEGERIITPGRSRRTAICRCICGFVGTYLHEQVVNGKTKSCGCWRREKSAELRKYTTKHGDASGGKCSPEYRAWNGIKDRCLNPQHPAYEHYGGRGITIFAEWIDDFPAFLRYVGRRPSPAHSIDRWPDNDDGYRPGNVRWATRDEQNNNRRGMAVVEYNGQSRTVREWAKITGLSEGMLYQRRTKGKSPAEILKGASI